jgi:hypothetical protein
VTFNPDMTNAALLRMRKANEAGRGVRLSANELDAFSVELLGEWWHSIDEEGRNTQDPDYRKLKGSE